MPVVSTTLFRFSCHNVPGHGILRIAPARPPMRNNQNKALDSCYFYVRKEETASRDHAGKPEGGRAEAIMI